jgi:hypothetical protein
MRNRMETPSKPQLKKWKKLTMEKYRRREKLFLAEGKRVVEELLRSNRPLEALLVCEGKTDRWNRDLPTFSARVGRCEPGCVSGGGNGSDCNAAAFGSVLPAG